MKAMKPVIEKYFYFIRHGQTDPNINGLVCGGDWDVPINNTGVDQAINARGIVEKLSPVPTRICSSPMIRAQLTSKLINENFNLPIASVEGLREWCVGDWENKPFDDVPNPFNTTIDPPNGETREIFEERVIAAVNSSLEKYPDDVILFVAHGAVAHSLFTCMGIDQPMIDNASIYKVEPKNNRWSIQLQT
jgi:broad specificity phosphatase PhoE